MVAALLLTFGFCGAALLIIMFVSQFSVSASSIAVDVRTFSTDPPDDPKLIMTDAAGFTIPRTSLTIRQCSWYCGGITWTYGWTPQTLAPHPQPYTLTVVSHGNLIDSQPVQTWHAYNAGSSEIWGSSDLIPVWYQTDMAKALLLAVGAWALIKFICYVSLLKRWPRKSLPITICNAVALPATCSFAFAFFGDVIAVPLLIGIIIFDTTHLKMTTRIGSWAALVVIGANIAGFVAATMIGLHWDLMGMIGAI